MTRETRRSRGVNAPDTNRITAAHNWTGAIIESNLVRRRVAQEANPMEGLGNAGRNMAGQMLQFSQDMGRFFGNMTQSLTNMARIAHAEDLAKIDIENDNLRHKARLDHYNQAAPSSDAAAYRFERVRLERAEAEAEARREYLKARAVASGAGTARAGTPLTHQSDEDKAKAATQAMEAARIRAAVSSTGAPSALLSTNTKTPKAQPDRPSVPALPYLPQQDIKLELKQTASKIPSMLSAPPMAQPQDWGDTPAATDLERGVRAGGTIDVSNAPVDIEFRGSGRNRRPVGMKLNEVTAHDVARDIEFSFKTEVLPNVDASMDIAAVYALRDEHIARRLEGAPDFALVQVADIVSKSTRNDITNHLLGQRKEFMEDRARTFENNLYARAVEGNPPDHETLQRLIMDASQFYQDDRVARQAAARAIVNGTVNRITEGDTDAYMRAMQTLSPIFRDLGNETHDIRKRLADAYDRHVRNEVTAVSNALRDAVADEDEEAVISLMTENKHFRNHPSIQGAHRQASRFLQRQADERAEEERREAVFEGFVNRSYLPTAEDMRVVEKKADERARQWFEAGDTRSIAQLAENMQELPKSFAGYLNFILTNVSAIDNLMVKDASGEMVPSQHLVAIERAYELAKMVSPTVRAESLNESARAVLSLIGEDNTVPFPDRVNNALKALERHEGRLRQSDLQRDLRAFFPEAKSAADAEAELIDSILEVAKNHRASRMDSVSIRNPEALIDRVRLEAARHLALTGGMANPEMLDEIIEGALANHMPVPVGSQWMGMGQETELIEVPKEVLMHWGTTPEAVRHSSSVFMDNIATASKATNGVVPANTSVSATDPRLAQDRREGWLQVTNVDNMGLPVFFAPGAEVSLSREEERRATGGIVASTITEIVTEDVALPTDLAEFAAQIDEWNETLLPTGFQILPYNDAMNAYYLAYRPVSEVELSEIERLRSAEGFGASRIEKALDESWRTATARLATMNLGGVLSDPGEKLSEIVEQSLEQLTQNRLVPKSLGLTVPVPDRFENAEEALDWLARAHETYRINYALGRPKSPNKNLPEEKQIIDFVESIHGTLDRVHRMAGDEDTLVIGSGIRFDADWVQEGLREMGYSAKDIRDIRDGRRELSPGHAELLTIEGVRRAEQTMRSKLDVRKLPNIPFDAYKVLTALVFEDDKLLSKDFVEAFNDENWDRVSSLIATSVPKRGHKDYRQYMVYLRAQMANIFARSVGANPINIQ